MNSQISTSKHSINQQRAYSRSECVIVYKTKESFGGLSNMASGYPLTVNSIRILTSEALYQACRFPHLPEIQKEIIGQISPMTAKMKGKPHRSNTRSDWENVKHKIMRWCLRVKLAQHYERFGDLLIATNERAIVEMSRKDTYWGAKLQDDGETLIGENVLGRLLMELRERLQNSSEDDLLIVQPLPIPDFLLLGNPIEPIFNKKIFHNPPQPPLF